jgi:hypothetical protein
VRAIKRRADVGLSPIELAQVAYAAYGGATDHKNYQGLPMPEWDDLPETIQQAWVSAALAVRCVSA